MFRSSADGQFTMFGYDQGVLSSLLTLPAFIETFPSTAAGFGYAQSLLVAVCEWEHFGSGYSG